MPVIQRDQTIHNEGAEAFTNSLQHLLRPLAARLNAASRNLNDMRVVDQTDVVPRREQ